MMLFCLQPRRLVKHSSCGQRWIWDILFLRKTSSLHKTTQISDPCVILLAFIATTDLQGDSNGDETGSFVISEQWCCYLIMVRFQ